MKPLAQNKKAFFDYTVQDQWQAGLVLLGSEIKIARAGRVTISGSYIRPFTGENGKIELWWVGSHFPGAPDETRTKKILLSRAEIEKIQGKLSAGEYTIIPLELFLQRGLAKLTIGLATRKKKHDKREVLKRRDSDRDISQQFGRRR